MSRIDIRVTFSKELTEKLRAYLKENWPGEDMTANVIRKSVREFLDRQDNLEKEFATAAHEAIKMKNKEEEKA